VLLVDIVHDLGMPHVVQRIHHELCLDLGERVPVAVVVVPGVVVVQLRGVGALGGRAEGAVVPARDDRDAGGVGRRDGQQDTAGGSRACGGGRIAGEAGRDDRGGEL